MKFLKIVMLVVFIGCMSLHAKYVAIKNDVQFADQINKYEFVVVCFIDDISDDKHVDKQLKKDVEVLQKTIKAASQTEPFNKLLKQEVGFLVVDTSRDDVEPLLKKYKIECDGKPQFLLFKDGKVLTELSGQVAEIDGFISKADLLAFMDDYFGKDFDDILAKKADEQAQDREMQLARYQMYGATRYPYGGYAPYNPWGSPAPSIYTGYAAFYPYGYSYNGYAYFIP